MTMHIWMLTECRPDFFGVGCLQRCLCNDSGSIGCDFITGVCLCATGWIGEICDQRKNSTCLSDKYEFIIFLVKYFAQVYMSIKFMLKKFLWNIFWNIFFLECPASYYGAKCKLRCDCVHSTSCDSITGECHCKAGFYGARCDRR